MELFTTDNAVQHSLVSIVCSSMETEGRQRGHCTRLWNISFAGSALGQVAVALHTRSSISEQAVIV